MACQELGRTAGGERSLICIHSRSPAPAALLQAHLGSSGVRCPREHGSLVPQRPGTAELDRAEHRVRDAASDPRPHYTDEETGPAGVNGFAPGHTRKGLGPGSPTLKFLLIISKQKKAIGRPTWTLYNETLPEVSRKCSNAKGPSIYNYKAFTLQF